MYMKNGKKLVRLLALLFLTVLTLNLFSQEKQKKEKKIIYKTIAKKGGKKMKWVKKDGAYDIVWHVKANDLEWDTTFNVDDGNDFDVHVFLRKRFPEMDTMKNQKIEIHMDGDEYKIHLSSGGHHKKLIEIRNNILIDDDGGIIEIHMEHLDSLKTKHGKLKNLMFIGDDRSADIKVLHENLGDIKYEILTSIAEADCERIVSLEVIKDIKKEMRNIAFVIHADGDDHFDVKHFSGHQTEEMHFGLEINDELEQADVDFLKKSGVKVGSNTLDLSKLFFYSGEEGFLNLKFKLKSKGKATIKIISVRGVDIFTDKVKYFPGTYDKQTELSMESKGQYYVSIEQNGKTKAYKFKLD